MIQIPVIFICMNGAIPNKKTLHLNGHKQDADVKLHADADFILLHDAIAFSLSLNSLMIAFGGSLHEIL